MSPTINESTLTELQRAGYSEAEIEEMASVAITIGVSTGISSHEAASLIRKIALRSSDGITEFLINMGGKCMNPERIYAAMMVADAIGASMHCEPQGGLFAKSYDKSYDKDFNRKKKHRKMAKASKRRNRKNLRSRKCI